MATEAVDVPAGFVLDNLPKVDEASLAKARLPKDFILDIVPKVLSRTGAGEPPKITGLPEFGTVDGNKALFGDAMGFEGGVGRQFRDGVAGLLTLNKAARVDGIEKRFPEFQVDRFDNGENAIVTDLDSGNRAVVNAEGLSNTDIAPLVGMVAASTPVGGSVAKAGTLLGKVATGAIGEGVVDAGFQGAEILQGSEQGIDIGRTATSATIGAAGSGAIALLQSRKLRNDSLKKILETNPDSTVAKYTLNSAGKVKSDPLAKEVLKQGLDEGVVATMKGASPTDKLKMTRMVGVLEKGIKDPRFAAIHRPSDIIGDSVMQRFGVVHNANRASAKQLDGVANSLKGKDVDVSEPVDAFLDDLSDMGIQFDSKTLKPRYHNSDIEGLKGPQGIFNRIINRMTNTKPPDAYDVHRLKRFIDQQVTFGRNAKGLSGQAENVLKRLRHNLDSRLDESFPEYNKVNTMYSQTRNAIDSFQSAAGKKIDLGGENASKAVGTLSRRILSNAQSRAQVLDVLQELQDTAIAQGGKFDDDLITQVVFVDDLERTFGSSAKASFAGDIEKSVKQAGTAAGKLRNSQGLIDLSINAVATGVEKARGINRENGIKAIKDLLAN